VDIVEEAIAAIASAAAQRETGTGSKDGVGPSPAAPPPPAVSAPETAARSSAALATRRSETGGGGGEGSGGDSGGVSHVFRAEQERWIAVLPAVGTPE
jgi:hypothetical protein